MPKTTVHGGGSFGPTPAPWDRMAARPHQTETRAGPWRAYAATLGAPPNISDDHDTKTADRFRTWVDNKLSRLEQIREPFVHVVDVRDFDAVGDGVKDDTAAVDAARAVAAERRVSVYFPSPPVAWTYHGDLQMNKGEVWRGSGMRSTRLRFLGGGVIAEDNISMYDMRISGNREPGSVGLSAINSASRSHVHSTWIDNFDIGIRANEAWIWKLDDVFLVSNVSRGIRFETLATMWVMNGGEIIGSEWGVEHQYSVKHSFTGVTIESSKSGGVLTSGNLYKGGISYTGCYFEGNSGHDILVNGSHVMGMAVRDSSFSETPVGVELAPDPGRVAHTIGYVPGCGRFHYDNNCVVSGGGVPLLIGANAERTIVGSISQRDTSVAFDPAVHDNGQGTVYAGGP